MINLKRYILTLIHTIKLVVGIGIYNFTKKTPEYAYQSMIFLFCRSKGRSNDLLSWMIKTKNGKYNFASSDRILGSLSITHRKKINTALLEHGYYIFDSRLPDDICDRLLDYSLTQPCYMRCMDDGSFSAPIRTAYHRDNPQAVRYDFETQDLLKNEDIQSIMADEGFATVAQDYLGSKPIIDIVTMWWHTRFSDKPDMAAAQYFHFDMDRPKWLKFFIYLTDVDTDNGPHTFVAGTHKAGAIPAKLLNKGYARLNDSEVHDEFDNSQFIEFNAPRGTIIAEDTRGLHKGKHVENGDRLIFQIEYCNSLFGGAYQKTTCDAPKTTKLNEMFKKYKAIYKLYL
ncbi:phytanoyl-CoA dioxygenase family protein [Methylophilus sp. UBA6697]|uniref:phytanoyl-CoA dioxygenase family protein n=1 Tax=Methylophilus sp. UBA6697 TaxID=1946902 RepID=UPI0025F3794B|nr:phytanoyl-CoA dioxygenase family protein [Methylophilus sp. UBA6697]